MKQLRQIDILTILVITIWGILRREVTVFYIIYLFWFQEAIRTLVDFIYLLLHKKTLADRKLLLAQAFGAGFLLFIYLVFIVLLFGFMLNWEQSELLGANARMLFFQNTFFNVNILLFLIEYTYFRIKVEDNNLQIQTFNRRHIILHISIIVGAFIQLVVVQHYDMTGLWGSVAVIAPFLLLKIWIDKSENNRHEVTNKTLVPWGINAERNRTRNKKMKITKNDILFTLALVFALWFTATGIFWVYWTALFVAYPFGIASLFIWQNIRKDGRKRNAIIPVILIAGLLLSLGMLLPSLINRLGIDCC